MTLNREFSITFARNRLLFSCSLPHRAVRGAKEEIPVQLLFHLFFLIMAFNMMPHTLHLSHYPNHAIIAYLSSLETRLDFPSYLHSPRTSLSRKFISQSVFVKRL